MQLSDFATFPNLVSMFLARAAERGDGPFLWNKAGGKWHARSWRQVADEVCLLAQNLRALGLNDGDRVALISGDEQLTYGQLEEKANRLAHYLIDQGVKKDDKVGLYCRNRIEIVIGMRSEEHTSELQSH